MVLPTKVTRTTSLVHLALMKMVIFEMNGTYDYDCETVVLIKQCLMAAKHCICKMMPEYTTISAKQIGYGWKGTTTLWDGHQVLGWLSADNFLDETPFSQQQGELLKLYGLTLGHLCTQQRTQETLSQSVQNAVQFQDMLKQLHEVSLLLANAEDFDDLCRSAIELGRSRLGFTRLGLWFRDKNDPDMMVGSFGTDENGNIRDERGIRNPIDSNYNYSKILKGKHSFEYMENTPLFNHTSDVVGQGWLGITTLWDGDEIIGWLSSEQLK